MLRGASARNPCSPCSTCTRLHKPFIHVCEITVIMLLLISLLLLAITPLPLLIVTHALSDLLLDLCAPSIENESDQEDQSNDEEPDELGCDTLRLRLAEISFPALTAVAPAVTALASMLANAATTLTLLF